MAYKKQSLIILYIYLYFFKFLLYVFDNYIPVFRSCHHEILIENITILALTPR